jgi:helicase
MTDSAEYLGDSPEIQHLLKQVEAERLLQQLNEPGLHAFQNGASAQLRVAATLSLAELMGEEVPDVWLRRTSSDPRGLQETDTSVSVFEKWAGYINALLENAEHPTLDDLVFLAVAALLARRQTDFRTLLRQQSIREAVDRYDISPDQMPWPDWVRASINRALLLLMRQAHRRDVLAANETIKQLSDYQRQLDARWLEHNPNPSRDALKLLAFYHLAQAVTRTSEFLLSGSVKVDDRLVSDFGPELRRLLVRAEDYLSLSRDAESIFWLMAVTIILWQLRSESVWVWGKGISHRLDRLIDSLVQEGREQPVFSLLPSQQDALRQNLTDRSRVAIVLQMPTSSGKTLMAEFAIVQAFEAYRETARVVYVVPTRALATQVRRTLAEDLRPLGIEVSAAGSAFEEDPYELNMLKSADGVVVTTPEKLDLILRTNPEWFSALRLVVVDEAHLLNETQSDRGVRLELLLANIRREYPDARLLLLTPFSDNAVEIAAWLGGERGQAITVHWRPSRSLLGLAHISGRGKQRSLSIELRSPYAPHHQPVRLAIRTDVRSTEVQNALGRVVFLSGIFERLGTVLALFSASRKDAEDAAQRLADPRPKLASSAMTPALRLAIALAEDEFGAEASLPYCLQRGITFHHSALSPILRYLIEDQIRAKVITVVAGTTTLAQGMNFPVASVLVHSVHKPYGRGELSPGEFWNVAGRAGRVGMADQGIIVFANPKHQDHLANYSSHLTEKLRSALLDILRQLQPGVPLRTYYDDYPEIRPFFQYLNHIAATRTPARALADLEELLQASLANTQIDSQVDAQRMRVLARSYLTEISRHQVPYLKAIDSSGLGSFSFNELYSKIRLDEVLAAGPGQVLRGQVDGLNRLVEALKWLPELGLAIGFGDGPMDTRAVARVLQAWMNGTSVRDLASHFPGEDDAARVRKAATYVYQKVTQSLAWGAHAYIRGWRMNSSEGAPMSAEEAMLPAYIQHGVKTAEAAVSSLLGVPRQLAEAFGAEYRERNGPLLPEDTPAFQEFVEQADPKVWKNVTERSNLAGRIDATDVRQVWRQMQGLPTTE